MPWGDPLPISRKQNKEEIVHCISPCVYISAVFDSLSLILPFCTFQGAKGKEKKTNYIFIHLCYSSSCLYAIRPTIQLSQKTDKPKNTTTNSIKVTKSKEFQYQYASKHLKRIQKYFCPQYTYKLSMTCVPAL